MKLFKKPLLKKIGEYYPGENNNLFTVSRNEGSPQPNSNNVYIFVIFHKFLEAHTSKNINLEKLRMEYTLESQKLG